ncbi:MAG TPA: hypothetical protein VL688_06300 [Verrucomicrobiae bacterium]|jgi:general secretion pathway protein K|nr:hypothetical protein [Verrucomicrobiae bacterium]
MAIGFGAVSLFSINATETLRYSLESYGAARAGLPYVLYQLENDKSPKYDGSADGWSDNESLFRDHPLQGGVFSVYHEVLNEYSGQTERKYGILDEESKLNVNRAKTDILKNLLVLAAGLKEEDAAVLANRITDWRDDDTEPTLPGGAEKYDYLSMRGAYEPKDGDLQSIEELLLVKGMTPEIFSSIRPYVTVYGDGTVNVNTAGSKVLLSLGLSEAAVNGVRLFRLGGDGEAGTQDDGIVTSKSAISGELGTYIPMEDMNRLNELLQGDLLGVSSSTFSFTSEGRLEHEAAPVIIDCVLERTGEIVSWSQR